jgi:hypothetical protein
MELPIVGSITQVAGSWGWSGGGQYVCATFNVWPIPGSVPGKSTRFSPMTESKTDRVSASDGWCVWARSTRVGERSAGVVEPGNQPGKAAASLAIVSSSKVQQGSV